MLIDPNMRCYPPSVKSCATTTLYYDVNGTMQCSVAIINGQWYEIDANGEISVTTTPQTCSGSKIPIESIFDSSSVAFCEAVTAQTTLEAAATTNMFKHRSI